LPVGEERCNVIARHWQKVCECSHAIVYSSR
jgi:hypothetical protein